ncbi:hypothetical protein F9K33_09290 [bacterium]|nr:MAG: hypothetical protein F9K33_09290 [bacterium]
MNHVLFFRILAAFALFFGIATIKEGGAVLFFNGEARLAAGQYVPFVLWFNFCAGFLYILSGIGLWFIRSWGVKLAFFIFISTGVIFIAFGIHVWSGGLFENRTVMAMTIRTVVWALISFAGYYLYQRKQTDLVK